MPCPFMKRMLIPGVLSSLALAFLIIGAECQTCNYPTCAGCLEDESCGWCVDDNKCKLASSESACDAFELISCPAVDCTQLRNCKSCTASEFCGWCPSTSSCSSGDPLKPSIGICEDWAWIACADSIPSFLASFSPSGTTIIVTFDISTDEANQEGSFPCSHIITESAPLGTEASCVFLSDIRLLIRLADDSTIHPGASLEINNVRAANSNLTAAITGTVEASENPLFALYLNSPRELSNSQTSFSIEVSAVGTAGRAFETPLEWTITPAVSSIQALLDASIGNATVTIPTADMTYGLLYFIEVNATNFLGLAATAKQEVTRFSIPIAEVNMRGPSTITVNADDDLIISASVSVPTAFGNPDPRFSYSWSRVAGPPLVLDAPTSVTNLLHLVPRQLVGGNTYEIELVVAMDDDLTKLGSDNIIIVVEASPISVRFADGLRSINRMQDLIVEAMVDDPDDSDEPVLYEFDCHESLDPYKKCSVAELVADQTKARHVVSASYFPPGEQVFTVTAVKGTRKAKASTIFYVQWIPSPDVRVFIFDIDGSSALQIDADKRLVIQSRVTPYSSTDSTVGRWSQIGGPLANISETTLAKSSLEINAGTLFPATSYTFRYTVPASTGLVGPAVRAEGYADITFRTNEAPRLGTCVSSSNGGTTSIDTIWNIECSGWEDDGGQYPLAYEYYFIDKFGNRALISTGPEVQTTISFTLPPGVTEFGVDVVDTFGARTRGLTVSLLVESPTVALGDGSYYERVEDARLIGSIPLIGQIFNALFTELHTESFASNETLAEGREIYNEIIDQYDKEYIFLPSAEWILQWGYHFSVATQTPEIISEDARVITIDFANDRFEVYAPQAQNSNNYWTVTLSNLLESLDILGRDEDFDRAEKFASAFVTATGTIVDGQLDITVPDYGSRDVLSNNVAIRVEKTNSIPDQFKYSQPAAGVHVELDQPVIDKLNSGSDVISMYLITLEVNPFQYDLDNVSTGIETPVASFVARDGTGNSLTSGALAGEGIVYELPLRGSQENDTFLCVAWNEGINLWEADVCESLTEEAAQQTALCRCTVGDRYIAAVLVRPPPSPTSSAESAPFIVNGKLIILALVALLLAVILSVLLAWTLKPKSRTEEEEEDVLTLEPKKPEPVLPEDQLASLHLNEPKRGGNKPISVIWYETAESDVASEEGEYSLSDSSNAESPKTESVRVTSDEAGIPAGADDEEMSPSQYDVSEDDEEEEDSRDSKDSKDSKDKDDE